MFFKYLSLLILEFEKLEFLLINLILCVELFVFLILNFVLVFEFF